MRNSFLLTSIFSLFFNILTVFGQIFQTAIGEPLPSNERGASGLITNAGDYLILGDKKPSLGIIQHGDMELVRLDNLGNVIPPSKIIGQDLDERANWIEKSAGCAGSPGYIVAGTQYNGAGDMLLTLTNAAGNPQWVRRIGTPTDDETSACVKQDGANNFILVGTKTNWGAGISAVHAVKTDCSGNLLWERVYSLNGSSLTTASVTAFATFPNPLCGSLPNVYYITGKLTPTASGGNEKVFILSVNATNGSVGFMKTYDIAPGADDVGTCIQGKCSSTPGSAAGLWVSGYSQDASNGSKKVLMMQTDLNGNLVWGKNYNVSNSKRELATHFQFAANNKLVVTGKAEDTGASDPSEIGQCLLMRIADNGNSVDWTRVFDMGFASQGNRVEPTAADEYFVTGHTYEIVQPQRFDYNILAIKTDALGRTTNACYHSPNTLIEAQSPTVTGADPSQPVPQDFFSSDLLVVSRDESQTFCPEQRCDQVGATSKDVNDPKAGKCCQRITLSNGYQSGYFSGVQFTGLNGVQLSYSSVLAPWIVMGHTPSTVTIGHGSGSIPTGNFPDVVELCLSNYTSSPQKVVVQWLGPAPDSIVVCTDTLEFDCPVDGQYPSRCALAVNDSLFCKDGKYTYTFKIQNNAPFNIQSFVITPSDPNITVTPALTNVPFPGIPSNSTSGSFTVNLTGTGLIPGNLFCFYLTAHDVPIIIGDGNFPRECCTDSVNLRCLPIPACDPCDGVTITPDMAAQPTNGDCCILLSIDNNYYAGYFTGVQVTSLGGVYLSYVSGWSIDMSAMSPSSVTFIPPGGTLGTGAFSHFAEICLNGFTTSPQYFVVNLLGPDGTVVCSDTLRSDCAPPPPPTCAIATNDSLWCDGGQVKYTFWIKNSPFNTFDIESFNLVLADPTGFNVSQDYFVLGTPLAPGDEAGPFTIDVSGSAAQADSQFCFVISAHDGVWDSIPAHWPHTCCTDSFNVRCLPIPDCSGQDSCCCCTGSDLKLPNGFSPNGDGVHDKYKITKLTAGKNCGKISLTVFNRWGNIVWQSDDYQDQWGGTNQSGTSLPEGTYYVLMKIESTGLTLTNFVELRR